jgi:hypothetical protein
MAIDGLFRNSAFGPDEIQVMSCAYEDALRALELADPSDPITQIVAGKIIELAQRGVRDRDLLLQIALQEIRALS